MPESNTSCEKVVAMIRNVRVIRKTLVSVLLGWALGAPAAPLPNGTLLTIEPGLSSIPNGLCFSGSCFTWIVAPIHDWTMLQAGTDGGIVLGKNQTSGGQEIGSSQYNTTSGELTAAWFFFGNYGTFATAPLAGSNGGVVSTDASRNRFDDTSCSGLAACAGKTVLGTLTGAWNGHAVPLGSAYCSDGNCSTDPRVGVYEWRVNADDTYYLDYLGVVPIGDSSQFGGTELRLILRGRIIRPPNSAPTAGDVSAVGVSGLLVAWQPEATDDNGDPLTCRLDTLPQNGIATVAPDCSTGTYQFNLGFIGIDSFTYVANDGQFNSNAATVTVAVTEPPPTDSCVALYPVSQFSSAGKQGTLNILFTGNIVSHANKEVKICPGTALTYEAGSTAGDVICKVKNNTTPGTGTLRINDYIKCTDKPAGKDKVHFKMKSGVE